MFLQSQVFPPIRKGDTVQVTSGRERGKTGKIIQVLFKKNRVVVEKLNMVKRHARPTQKNPQGVLMKEAAVHVSNVLLVCPKCNRGVRVGRKLEGDKKLRICKKCKTTV